MPIFIIGFIMPPFMFMPPGIMPGAPAPPPPVDIIAEALAITIARISGGRVFIWSSGMPAKFYMDNGQLVI